MSELTAVIDRFPAHELIIRRLYHSEADFKRLCEDHETAQVALEHWRHDEGRARDYERLILEIEAEIQEMLDRAISLVLKTTTPEKS